MPAKVRYKDGVRFDCIAPAGFRIIAGLECTARRVDHDLTITSGTDNHQRPDPHALGEAFDVRTHDLPTRGFKLRVLRELMIHLADEADPYDQPKDEFDGMTTKFFFGWIEHPGASNEHLHVQRRKGRVYV